MSIMFIHIYIYINKDSYLTIFSGFVKEKFHTQLKWQSSVALSAGAVECNDCFSDYDTKQSGGEVPVILEL